MTNNQFTIPKKLSPFYENKRLPRKLKKKIKQLWEEMFYSFKKVDLDCGQLHWWYLGETNVKYKKFLIFQICKNKENNQ